MPSRSERSESRLAVWFSILALSSCSESVRPPRAPRYQPSVLDARPGAEEGEGDGTHPAAPSSRS